MRLPCWREREALDKLPAAGMIVRHETLFKQEGRQT